MEVKTRRSKFKCKKKVSNKQALAQATKEVKLISEWFGESIRIAKDAVMAVKAMEDWLHKLPHEVQKQLYKDDYPIIDWEKNKKSAVCKWFIDPDQDCGPCVVLPKPKPGIYTAQTAPLKPETALQT